MRTRSSASRRRCPQGPVVVGRPLVVVELRLDRRRVLGRLLGQRRAPRRILRIEPLALGERLVELRHDGLAVADQRHLGRLVVADLLRRDVELDDLDVLGEARRQAEVEDPVEAARPSGRRRRPAAAPACAPPPTDSGWSSGITPLPIGERTNGTCVRSMKARTSSSRARPGHALADEHERPLGLLEQVQRRLDILRGAIMRGGSGTRSACVRPCRGRTCPG